MKSSCFKVLCGLVNVWQGSLKTMIPPSTSTTNSSDGRTILEINSWLWLPVAKSKVSPSYNLTMIVCSNAVPWAVPLQSLKVNIVVKECSEFLRSAKSHTDGLHMFSTVDIFTLLHPLLTVLNRSVWKKIMLKRHLLDYRILIFFITLSYILHTFLRSNGGCC